MGPWPEKHKNYTTMKVFRILSTLSLFLLGGVVMLAQQDTLVVPPALGPDATLPDFVNLYGGLQSAITILLGYVHNWIPGLNFIPAKWLRIILIGAVTAVIFAVLGLNSGLGTALVFLQTVGFYELIFKRVLPASAPVKDVMFKKRAA